jgi:hypothetical protein
LPGRRSGYGDSINKNGDELVYEIGKLEEEEEEAMFGRTNYISVEAARPEKGENGAS